MGKKGKILKFDKSNLILLKKREKGKKSITLINALSYLCRENPCAFLQKK